MSSTTSLRALARVCLVALLAGNGCSSQPSHDRPASSDGPAKTRLYEQAAAGHWYVVGGSVFQRISPGFPRSVMPKQLGPASKTPLALRDAKFFGSLDISPDGEHLAALTTAWDAKGVDAHLLIFDRKLAVVHSDPSETNVGQKGINTRSELRWSPDGKLLAYAQSGTIWLIDPELPGRRALVSDHQHTLSFAAPSWGPTGALVYETTGRDVARIDLDAAHEPGPAQILAHGRFPSWSPDGSKIVYRKDNGDVYVYELASATESKIFALAGHKPNYVWTPDSQYILFDQTIHNSYKSNYFVYSFVDQAVIDLRTRYGGLDGHLVERLPDWVEARLVPLE